MKSSAYKKILGKIPAGVFVFDESLRILYVNDAFSRVFSPDFSATSNAAEKPLSIEKFYGKKSVFPDLLLCCPERAARITAPLKQGKKGDSCAADFCACDSCAKPCVFYDTMRRAVAENTEQSGVVTVTADKVSRRETLKTRVRILPVDDFDDFNAKNDRGGENDCAKNQTTEQNAKQRATKKKKIKFPKHRLFLGLTDGVLQTEIAREMLTARQMQQRLLPAGKQTGGVPYSYMYIPSLEIGGDLPDVYEYGGRVYGVLSDVSGKGISAGMLSAFIRASYDHREISVAKAVSSLRDKFVELNPDERSYITVAAVSIDRTAHTLHYLLAGHNAPILLRSARSMGINEIEDPAPPVSNWMTEFVYAEKQMPYEEGDLLVLLSDGVTECPNRTGERFGVERVESVLMQSANAEDFIGKLKNALTIFSGGKFNDDLTAVAFDLT